MSDDPRQAAERYRLDRRLRDLVELGAGLGTCGPQHLASHRLGLVAQSI